MATLIKVDGTLISIDPANKEAGFTLDELYSLVECEMIEAVYLSDGTIMAIDEEGKLTDPPKPVNRAATALTRDVLRANDLIVGNALICTKEEFQ